MSNTAERGNILPLKSTTTHKDGEPLHRPTPDSRIGAGGGKFLLLAAAGLICLLAGARPSAAQTCPLSYGTTDAAKSNWLYLYFPTSADSTFPNYGTNVSPAAAFNVTDLSSSIGTTAQLIDEIGKVVTDDYCEFNVQVHTTTSNPATLVSPPARRVTVAVGSDSNGTTWGQAQEVDIGDAVVIDFARVWAGTYTSCEGGSGPPSGAGPCTTGALTGANNTLEHWGQAIGGTSAHEAGHTYGLAHTDDDPPTDTSQAGPAPLPGEDPYYQHLMPAGFNLTGAQRTQYRRHFSDRTYGILANNVGLSIQTMHNWNLTNPNAQAGYSLTINFLSTLSAVTIDWSFGGASSPWLNPTVSGPSGTAVFKGTTYNKYTITWSSPNPAWTTSSPGVVAGGAVFHIGTTFTGVDFNAPDPIIIQDVTLFDASSNPLTLHPRLAGYDAGTVDAADGTFSLHFSATLSAATPFRLKGAKIYQLPRVASIDSMIGEGVPMARDKQPIRPWSVTECAGGSLREGVTCKVASTKQEPHVQDIFGLGQPGVYDCSKGVPQIPPRNPKSPGNIQDSAVPLDYEGPICAGAQRDPFPSTTVYVIATFEDPAAKHYDPVAKKYVVGPVESTAYYQFAGIREGRPATTGPGLTRYMYSAKFLCGEVEHREHDEDRGPLRVPVAPGTYYTAINIHNPTDNPVLLRFKFAASEHDGKPGAISRFAEIKLGPDEVISLDCRQVYELLHAKPDFVEGFAVVETDAELDVVGVYTVAGEHDKTPALETQRIPARVLR